MHALTYRKNQVESGLPLEAMATALKTLEKNNPEATRDSIMGDLFVYWHPDMGPGKAVITTKDGQTQTLDMPHRPRGARTKPEPTHIPSPCVLRLAPEKGVGLTVQVSASGAFTVVEGADSSPAPVLPDLPGQTPLQAQARAWLRDGRVGSSSYALCVALTGAKDPDRDEPGDTDIPWDASDFQRCQAFFKAVPAARPLLSKMADQGAYWAALVPVWGQLEGLAATESWESLRDAIRSAVDPLRSKPARPGASR